MSGTLYIVATPIGNREDISLRALRILKEVHAVIAEDTRHTRPLLFSYGISKEVIAYFEYSKQNRAESLLKRLEEGQNLALVSDAGTPTLSDPGARLVAQARRRNISVIPIPGPSALLASLSVSGLPTEPLHFWGFLSPSASKRRKVYAQIIALPGTHCFYESPHKILKHLDEWVQAFPDFTIFVSKEITKKFETHWIGPVTNVAEELRQSEVRGEYTVLLSREIF